MKPTVTLQFDSIAEMTAFFAGTALPQAATAVVAPPAVVVAASPAPVVTAAPEADDENGPVNTTAPTVDARGFMYDDRIHAKTRALNADGSWRRKRGVGDDIVNAVENEHRARMGQVQQPAPVAQFQQPAPAPAPAPVIAPQADPVQHLPQNPANYGIPAASIMPQPVQTMPPGYPAPAYQPEGTTVAYQQPQPAPAPAFVPPVQSAPPVQAIDFPAFMGVMQRALTQPGANGRPPIDANYNATLLQRVSQMTGVAVGNILDFRDRPDLIPTAFSVLQADGVIA